MKEFSSERFTENEYHTEPGKYLREHKRYKSQNTFFWTFALKVFRYDYLLRTIKDKDYVMINSGLAMADAVESRGGICHITGLESFRGGKGPYVIVGNHMGMLETMIPFHYTNVPLSYVVKNSLLNIPFFKTILSGCQAIGLTRTDIGKDLKTLMEEGQKRLAAGRSVVLFPAGSRYLDFDKAKFNSMGLRLARAAGVQMIPFAVKSDFLGRGHLMSYIGKLDPSKEIHFSFGKPVDPGKSGKEAHLAVVEEIAGKLESWGVDVYDSREKEKK